MRPSLIRTLGAILICLPIVGCGRTVVVRDGQGRPIAGAQVTTTSSLSIGSAARPTDQDGRTAAKKPMFQKQMWLSVSKAGYITYVGDFPKQWPADIVLREGNDPPPLDASVPPTFDFTHSDVIVPGK
jgi:hypothetical protein